LIKEVYDLCELCVSVVKVNPDIRRGDAEDAELRVLIKKYSALCELRVSAVNTHPQ
jgi:hypothetical protein